MDATEPCVPPGFRFHPTDEELVGYYLKKKVASQKIDLDVIRDIDLYRIEPWDLQERCRIGYEEQKEWYFFSHKDKKYPTGTRTNRATLAGFWKATGRDKAVYDKCRLIGMRKTLVFYKGRAPNGQKTDWIMHEYRLQSDDNGPPQEEGWVVCRAFKKRTNVQTKNIEGWDSSYVYEETSGVSSVMDPIHDFVTRQQTQTQTQTGFFRKSLLCKQEIDQSEALANLMSSTSVDHFLQLPQLESPSQTHFLKRASTSSLSLVSENSNKINNNGPDHDYISSIIEEKVTDWRALDKFVASQLSQDPDHQLIGDHHNSNEECSNSEMEALLMLHATSSSNGRSEDEIIESSKLITGFLSSSSAESDNLGICISDK